ncbi:hypothetical protein BJY04DRAFT_199139 [Aspergillus karnatakaensis]|uniref:putative quinol monooxygenase n=1 Tax=Aspergillus karnatakaensis TaxID=1810916 RepID=UPI003CCCE16C
MAISTSSSASYKGKQFTIFVTLRVAVENIEKFKAVHRPLWKYVAAEPENILFDVFEDLDAPGRFRFVEVWNQGREWFETQQITKPYYRILWEESQPLWIEDKKFEYYERTGEGFAVKEKYLEW